MIDSNGEADIQIKSTLKYTVKQTHAIQFPHHQPTHWQA